MPFREYVSKEYDKDGNGSLSETEITKITILNIKNNQGINDLTGMEYFTSLITLDCSGTAVSSLDVSNHPKLKNLVCTGTQITELNLSNNPALIKVECSNTGLTSRQKYPILTAAAPGSAVWILADRVICRICTVEIQRSANWILHRILNLKFWM